MKKLPLLFFILTSSFFILKAQNYHIVDSLHNEIKKFDTRKIELGRNATQLMDSTKADILYQLLVQYWGNLSDTAIYYGQQILSLSKQIGYKKGIGNANNGMGLHYMQRNNYPSALEYFQKALKIRTELGDIKDIAGTYNNMGLMYGREGEIDESIRYHTKSLNLKREIGDKDGMSASYGKIGHDYENLGKFPEAVSNYIDGLKSAEEAGDNLEISGLYKNIGDIYYEEGNYPEAIKNFSLALKMSIELGDKYSILLNYEDIGLICCKQGNDTGALRYMFAALKINRKFYLARTHYNLGNVYLAMGNYPMALCYADSSMNEYQIEGVQIGSKLNIEKGTIYEKQGKFRDALDYTLKGLSQAKQIGAKTDLKDAYKLLSVIHAEMHDFEEAYEASKEYENNLDSISNDAVQQKMTLLQVNYDFEKREDSMSAEREKKNIIKADESKRKSIITGSAIVISLLILIMASLAIKSQRIKHKKDKIIFENENHLLQLEKKGMEDELAKAKISLDDYIILMVEKNAMLEEFKTDMENLKNLKSKEIDENRVERLENLNRTTILTEDDWNKFKHLFEQVHRGFFTRLKEKLPDLTQAEIRLLCLTKLKSDTKQMGGILGVSFETIRKSRYRLRKKLNLPEENSLEDIANTI